MGRFSRRLAVQSEKIRRYFISLKVPSLHAPVEVKNILLLRQLLQKEVMNPSNWQAGAGVGEVKRAEEGRILKEIRRETDFVQKELVERAQRDFELRKMLKSKKYLYIDELGKIKLTNFFGLPGTSRPRVRIGKV